MCQSNRKLYQRREGVMRVIKFRAWDKEKKKWIINPEENSDYGIRIYLDGTIEPFFNADYGCSDKYKFPEEYTKNIILMQYTGLLDKDGKEIYEGDILKMIYEDNSFTIKEIKWEIFEDGEYGYGLGVGFNIHPDERNKESINLIIGNIYQHPELLE